jgi:hypothetical protein
MTTWLWAQTQDEFDSKHNMNLIQTQHIFELKQHEFEPMHNIALNSNNMYLNSHTTWIWNQA